MSIANKLSEIKIRHLPLRPPAMVERGASIREAVEAMKAKHLGCTLICEDGRLVGIFTERDLLNKVIGEPVGYAAPVDQVMTLNPEKLSLEDSVISVMYLMEDGDYRNIPLIDSQGRAVGVITVRDLITYFAERFPKEALNLPPEHDRPIMQAEGA
jgi:CBS domain-containing protein